MNEDELGDLTLATSLIAIAGFVDAVGFLTLRHLFVSFASGNSTQFALAAGEFAASKAAPAGALVGLFVVGIICGRLIANAAKDWRRPVILLAEAALLVAAAVAPLSGLWPGVLMTLAMGAQNSVLHKAGQTKTSLTYVTETLVNFGERLADALASEGPASACLPYLLFWMALVLGGAIGGIAHHGLGLRALLFPAAAVLFLAVGTGAIEWRRRRRDAGFRMH